MSIVQILSLIHISEKEIGQYEMNDLLYGRYFILESASPDSYIRDEGVYEVFIDTDGKTCLLYTSEHSISTPQPDIPKASETPAPPETEETPSETDFDINYWISFAKDYAQSVGLL